MPDHTLKSTSLLNRAAVKRYALQCARGRAHKFTRVSQEFIDRMEVLIDAKIRALNGHAAPVDQPLVLTATAKAKAVQRLNDCALALIGGAVKSHPSVGVTLK